ncbi:GNAT family N-acetyltransferase [Jannaschia ovalis]|uniref:L-ornithine N(alpha)-acyltransferase n=1 Tax=Jannaschia ovalis TaxID=3038773 RepID=A0ABY8LCD6_9RHOB|nr:GNAT family N-acetyltransferase [Jannaschia sp. GRR-S6-38]WGH78796.1 GNAT family N-acyltransferase [Jannaschia sp. GRR-S6-38]
MRPHLTLGRTPEELRAALALRRAVFVGEMGARDDGDAHDAACEHLVLRDADRPGLGAVGTLRLAMGAEYTAREFDLSRLVATGRPLAEAGRSCLHPDYRGGTAGLYLFRGLLDALRARGVGYLVGTASFPGADAARHMEALRRLRQEALAPEALRPVAHGPNAVAVAGTAPRAAMRAVPALIKTYLRAGAWVGEGAWRDPDFDTVDICMVLDMAKVPAGPLPRIAARMEAAAPS